jgi:hypothetical protein
MMRNTPGAEQILHNTTNHAAANITPVALQT